MASSGSGKRRGRRTGIGWAVWFWPRSWGSDRMVDDPAVTRGHSFPDEVGEKIASRRVCPDCCGSIELFPRDGCSKRGLHIPVDADQLSFPDPPPEQPVELVPAADEDENGLSLYCEPAQPEPEKARVDGITDYDRHHPMNRVPKNPTMRSPNER